MPWVDRVTVHVAAALRPALGLGDLPIGPARMMWWAERLMVERFVCQRHRLPQSLLVVDVTAARTDQHLGAAGMLADIFGSMHRLPSHSLPLLGIVDTRQRRDLAGADAVMLAGPCHVASVRQLCALFVARSNEANVARMADTPSVSCANPIAANTKARQTQSGHSPCWTQLRANATAWSSSWSKWVDVWPMAQTSTPPTQRAPSVPG